MNEQGKAPAAKKKILFVTNTMGRAGAEKCLQALMELLDPENAKKLYLPKRSIYTKVSDNAPAKYDLNCIVKNSLIILSMILI